LNTKTRTVPRIGKSSGQITGRSRVSSIYAWRHTFASLVVVAEDLRHFDHWVRQDRWPYVARPVCLVGRLALDSIEAVPSARSTRIYNETHYPLDLSRAFHGLMRCAIPTCRETVAIVGDYCIDVDDDGGTAEFDLFRLRLAAPQLRSYCRDRVPLSHVTQPACAPLAQDLRRAPCLGS
jgi:hypothetical protein